MREIKFRAWNTEMKHMVYPSLEFGRHIQFPCFYRRVTSGSGTENEVIMEMVSVDHILQDPIFNVMQFTGLYDKNGQEIYEGDIFKLGVEKEIFEVRFEYGCFMAFCKGKQYGLIGELQVCFIEVIGNIYENQNLINKK